MLVKGGQDPDKFQYNEKKCVFNECTIKVCISCSLRCPGTSEPSAPHLTLTVSLFLCSFASNAQAESRALWGNCVSSKIPSRVREGDEGVAGKNNREKYFLDKRSLFCPPGKSMIFYQSVLLMFDCLRPRDWKLTSPPEVTEWECKVTASNVKANEGHEGFHWPPMTMNLSLTSTFWTLQIPIFHSSLLGILP